MQIRHALAVMSTLVLCIALGAAQNDAPVRFNNFVVQLANVDLRAEDAAGALTLQLDSSEWLYISLSGEGAATVTLFADGEETVVLEAPGETMRHVGAGEIRLEIAGGEDARLERLIVRRVPEIMMYMYEEPASAAGKHDFIPHTWEDLESAVLHSANVIVSYDREVYIPYAEAWQARGGHWLINQGMSALRDETVDLAQHWAELLGGRVWNGSIHDEVVSRDVEYFERYAGGLARFRAMPESEGKTVYLYCGGTTGIGDPMLLDFFESTDATAAEGERSIHAMPQADANINARQISVELEPGVEYTISAYMRTDDCVPARYSGVFVIDHGWYALYGRLQAPEGDSDWTRYETTFIPKPSNNGLYEATLVGPASGGMWIDAVQIERGTEATAFTRGERNLLANPSFEDGLAEWMVGADEENALRAAVVEYDHVLTPELYLHEQPTEERARMRIERRLERLPAAWSRHYDGVGPSVLIALSLGDAPLRYTNDKFPNVNYKVLLDMQMHALATGEGTTNLRGVSFWSAWFGSLEAVRWYGELFRHYCIEGNTNRRTDDPYLLDHVANPGFEAGLEGWETEGAVEAVAIAEMPDEGPRGKHAMVPEGNQVIRTIRAEGGGANSFAQPIRNLEPGRAYSLKFYCADRDYADRMIPAEIAIEGGELLPEYTWNRRWMYREVDGGREIHWTMHRRVFRATGAEGRLAISDAAPGEVYWDFVQLEPFFEG